ncbi:MAG: hypothetical protein ACUVUG_00570 [Candidatus Aminicenantia bacterium]
MKVKDVILALLIIAFGLSINFLRNIKDNFSSLFKEKESFDYEEQIIDKGRKVIQIEGKNLKILIEGWDAEDIKGKLIKKILAFSKEEADKLAVKMKIEKKFFNDSLKYRIIPSSEPNFLLELKIPSKSSLKIKTENSDIEISNIKAELDIENSHGYVKTRNCEKNQSIKNSHGEIEVQNLNGDLKIFSSHSPIKVENTNNTEIEGGFEDVYVRNSKNLKLVVRHAPVELSEINGEIYIQNRHSTISVSKSSLKGRIEGRHLEINGDEISGEDLQISTSYEPVNLRDFSGNAKIYSKHNEIEIGALKGSNIEIDCKYSDITMNLDREWEGEVYLETLRGEIDASSLIEGVKMDGLGAKKRFKANLGGENILKIKTTYGRITLELK